jgi:hypothetical protein
MTSGGNPLIRQTITVATLVLFWATGASAADPLTTESDVTIGISEAKKAFVGIDESAVGPVTRYTAMTVKAPKWKRKKTRRALAFKIDLKDDESKAKTAEKAETRRASVDAAFAKLGATEVDTIAGGFTGRVRLLDSGIVVLTEDNKVLARTGDSSVMKTEVIVKNAAKMVGRCKGTVETRVMRVAVRPEWNAIAVQVETTCTFPEDEGTNRRVRQLFVKDISKLAD